MNYIYHPITYIITANITPLPPNYPALLQTMNTTLTLHSIHECEPSSSGDLAGEADGDGELEMLDVDAIIDMVVKSLADR